MTHKRKSPLAVRAVSVLVTMSFVMSSLLLMVGAGAGDHVALVDTANPFERTMLERSGVEVLEDYGAFAMVKGTEAQLSGLPVRRDLDDRTEIGIAGHVFDTREGGPSLPDALFRSPPDQGTSHFLVQFKGPIKQEWGATLLAMGAEPGNYIPNFVFIVRMDVSLVDDVRALPFVTWVGHYQPAYKVSSSVWAWDGALRLDIALHEGEDPDTVVNGLTDLGATIVIVSRDQVNPTIEALVAKEHVETIARMGPVWWIEIHHTGGVLPNDPAQWILQSNVQDYYPLYAHGIHGENMTMGNADTGVHVDHLAFHDANRAVQFTAPAANTPPDTQHRKVVNYWTFGDNTDQYAGGHGTRTAGVNVGDNDANNGNPQYHGIAYQAKLSFQDVWNDQTMQDARPANKGDMYDKTFRDGGWVHSGSLICFAGGEYNTEAMELDQFLWNHKDFLGVIANHNYGPNTNTVCDMASAKSTMSIGATENNPNQEDLHGYTGRGPTDDGRLKPTLSSVTDVNAPLDNTQNGFSDIGGTSGATPSAAGAMTLARQYFYDGFYPSGEKSPSDGFNASGALLKAVAVNGATEMTGTNAYVHPYNGMDYPSNTQGWGRLNLDEALYFPGDDKGLIIDDNRSGLSTGEDYLYLVDIVSDDVQLEITLVWTDYWGQPNAPKELVNDLDLEVTAPDGTTKFKGNVLGGSSNPHQSVIGGSFDDLNVVENFINITPTLGTWTIKVTGVNTPQGPQPYALVITGNISRPDDLAIGPENIVFTDDEPTEGDEISVNLTIRNIGGGPLAAVLAVIKLDGEVYDTRTMPVLGGLATYGIDWVSEWGSHTFSVELDPNDLIEEAREDNNDASRTIYVNKIPIADFEAAPAEIFTFENVTVNASASQDDGNITKYKFDWGDGKMTNWQPGPEAIHEYKVNGLFNVTVRVMDNRTVESDWAANISIMVKNRVPWVNASASTYEAYTYINISFDATGSGDRDGTITYLWDFEDGNTSESDRPTHGYDEDGYYNVSLKVTDDDGAENSTVIQVRILNRDPISSFTASGSLGNATTQFNFIPTVDDIDGDVVAFLWDFGDGNTSEEEAPVHKYGNDGEYNVTFHVLDDDGAQSEVTWWAITIVNLAPEANTTVNRTEALTFDRFEFTSTSFDIDGKIVRYVWNLGDGTFLEDEMVSHFYDEDGTYRISLKVWDDDDAMAEANLTVKVLNRAPRAVVVHNGTAVAGQLVTFSAINSTDRDGSIVSYLWDFGNGIEKREAEINYTFWSAGTYQVNLTITDNDLARSTVTVMVVVSPPPPPPPPPDPGLDLSSPLLFGLLALVMIIALLAVVFIMKRRKASSDQQQPPTGFDPNATAEAPPQDPYQDPGDQGSMYGDYGTGTEDQYQDQGQYQDQYEDQSSGTEGTEIIPEVGESEAPVPDEGAGQEPEPEPVQGITTEVAPEEAKKE